MTRTYRQAKRAEAQEETREKIVRATMELHLERGVATTSYPDVAERAGVGAATVYRHFPAMGALVEACGTRFRQMIDPPRPERAAAVFGHHREKKVRLERLVEELDAFYTRGSGPLAAAVRDQDRVAELAVFLIEIRSGVAGLVAQALDEDPQARLIAIASAVADFTVWSTLSGAVVDRDERIRLLVAMIEAAISPDGSERMTP